MPHQVQALEGTAFNNPSMIYRSNSFWKSSLRCSLLSERNFSCRIKGVFFIGSPFSVHLVVIWVTSVYFQSAKFRTFQIFHAKYCRTFKISLKHFCCNGTIIMLFYGSSAQSPCGQAAGVLTATAAVRPKRLKKTMRTKPLPLWHRIWR